VIPEDIRPQVDDVVNALKAVLEDNLVGVYLHGSTVLGCFGPWSDIDLLLVLSRPTSPHMKRRMAEVLLAVSAPYDPPGPPRPVEVDAIAEESLRPWRHPAQLDFHYSEEFREGIAAGDLEAWNDLESRALAAHITILRQAGVVLTGPPIELVFPEVPWPDYVHALTDDLSWLRKRLKEIPRYAVLSGARIWATLATRMPHSKASGAEWVLPRLPVELRPVLEHAVAVYRGQADEDWDGLPLDDYVAAVAEAIAAVTRRR
jgi:predicted nucleotidyltransferase